MKLVFIFALALFAKFALVESIVSGTAAVANKNKWATHHTFTWKFNGMKVRKIRCSGALVTLDAIITTAKCARQKSLYKNLIYIGQINFETGTPISPLKSVTHPNYNESTLLNNVALFYIATQTAGAAIGTVKMPIPTKPYLGVDTIMTGFGRPDFAQVPKNALQEGTNKIRKNEFCTSNPYVPIVPYNVTQVRNEELCIVYGSATDVPASASIPCLGGDEGSAATITEGADTNIMTGIFSYSAGAGNCLKTEPSVFVRMTKYVTWIAATITSFKN